MRCPRARWGEAGAKARKTRSEGTESDRDRRPPVGSEPRRYKAPRRGLDGRDESPRERARGPDPARTRRSAGREPTRLPTRTRRVPCPERSRRQAPRPRGPPPRVEPPRAAPPYTVTLPSSPLFVPPKRSKRIASAVETFSADRASPPRLRRRVRPQNQDARRGKPRPLQVWE